MRGLQTLAAAVLVAASVFAPPLAAQQSSNQAPAAAPASPETIKQDVDKIKKGRTLTISPASGAADSGGATILRFDNTSPFSLIVLLSGPTSQRIELLPERMQTLTILPGSYEIAFTVVGRDLPPFYGTQTIEANLRYLHKFVIPGI